MPEVRTERLRSGDTILTAGVSATATTNSYSKPTSASATETATSATVAVKQAGVDIIAVSK